jgi:lipopolysaccharide export system protein LptC
MIKKRIETKRAKELRNKRKHFAAPGGSHDKLVGFLARVLPAAVGLVAALMIITPLSPRGEVSFLLDRTQVAMIDSRLSVDNAVYRGKDNKERPFSLTAGEAVQRSSAEGVVRMRDLVARIALREGPAQILAKAGAYTIEQEKVAVIGPLNMKAADGYAMTASGVTLDLDERTMAGSRGVSGTVPAGTFSANSIDVDIDERTIVLEGNARLQMIPGKLRIP